MRLEELFKKNTKAALVACSNALDERARGKIAGVQLTLEKLNVEAVCSEHLYANVEGSTRAKVLMDFFHDEDLTEIFDVSGGDIANETLPYLDYDVIANASKRFWGYSDLTTIINAIYTKTGKESVLYQVRFLKEDLVEELFQVNYQFIQGNSMEGILVGGNIRCLLKLAGTEYWPDMSGKLLLLEARSGRVPQMITFLSQLKQLGVFDKVAGVLLGTFTEMEAEGYTPTVEELVKKFAGRELPIAKTYDIGHGSDAKAIVIGKDYKFESKEN